MSISVFVDINDWVETATVKGNNVIGQLGHNAMIEYEAKIA